VNKPKLLLADVSGRDAVKEIFAMYKLLTGREPTEKEKQQAELAMTGKISVKPRNSG